MRTTVIARVCTALICSLVLTLTSTTAQAFDREFYSGNDILFYNPDATDATCSEGVVSGALTGKDAAEKIFNYFIQKGLSGVQAAGIIGNLSVESGFDPQRIQGKPIGEGSKDPRDAGSSGWGLIQWTPGEKALTSADQAGLTGPIYELSTQLDLIWAHMNNKPAITTGSFSVSTFRNITDIEEAVRYFEHHIEGAGKPNYVDRYVAARLAQQQFSGQASTASAGSVVDPVSDCDSIGAGAVAGNITETALNYAWHEYHSPNYLKLKPSYAAAIDKAASEGKYVGGGEHPGVDCGGFVTRVMQDSGVDPNYGDGGNTSLQLAYLQNSQKYKELINPTTSDLTPGAIAIKTSGGGHTYLYVGKQAGFETQVASASYSPSGTSWRSPMAGMETPADPEYHWFVLK